MVGKLTLFGAPSILGGKMALWCGGIFAQIELRTLGGTLMLLGVCRALGPKLSGRRPVMENLVKGPNVMSLGSLPLSEMALGVFMAF